jgi:transcriptional regulator with XRE-family HTH domain
MDLRDVFAVNLRRLRHEKGLSQDDLAYEAEVSRSYLSQLEKGAFYASLKIIGRLAEALGVEPAELLKRGAIEKERSRRERR